MYIILVYDCGEKRVAKMLKLCRQYLNWIQNSVFEGELTPVQLKELLHKAKQLMDLSYDSVIVFSTNQKKRIKRKVIGIERNEVSDFL